jgi:hypothetical protein
VLSLPSADLPTLWGPLCVSVTDVAEQHCLAAYVGQAATFTTPSRCMPLSPPLQVDLNFDSCPLLQPLPRYMYALLRSPLLSSAAQYHSDLTAYLHHLWCALPPHELAKAVYPGLSAFADTDHLIATGLPLSRHSLQGPALAAAAIAAAKKAVGAAKASVPAQGGSSAISTADAGRVGSTFLAGAAGGGVPTAEQQGGTVGSAESAEPVGGDSAPAPPDPAAAAAAQAALSLSAAVAEGRQGANVLLLDAFILVLVLYRSSAGAEMQFPPAQDSLLWRTITDIKRVRTWGGWLGQASAGLLRK